MSKVITNYEYGAIGCIGKLIRLPLWKEINEVNAHFFLGFLNGKPFFVMYLSAYLHLLGGER